MNTPKAIDPQADTLEQGDTANQAEATVSARTDDNVDQDGHCITAAYGESVGPNSGDPCDDGRAGGE